MSIENKNLHVVKVFNEHIFEAEYETIIYPTRKLAQERADEVNKQDYMKAEVHNWQFKI